MSSRAAFGQRQNEKGSSWMPGSNHFVTASVPVAQLNEEIMDTAFVKAVSAEGYPGGESALRKLHRFANSVHLGRHWAFKYLVDLDGVGYSGRFMAFLASDSVPLKATVYKEFFSDWIWKWDFDRLDIMCFNAVFNGVPVQPVLRSNYLQIHALEQSIKARFEHQISHLFALYLEDGALVYRSPDLDIHDVCALRKHTLKRVEKHLKQEA